MAKKMDWEALEEKKREELAESISDTEEAIGHEIFIDVMEEGNEKEVEILEKIKKCENLLRKYSKETGEMKKRSGEENCNHDKVESSLIKEIARLKSLEKKAREIEESASATEENGKNDKIAKRKAREVTDAEASAKKNDKNKKQKAREVTDADASAKKNDEEIDRFAKKKKMKDTATGAQRDNKIVRIVKEEFGEENVGVTKREKDNDIAKIVSTDLPTGYAQLGDEVKSEVAAAFPLLKAQRGESVAPSLILPHTLVKNESKKNNVKEIENDDDEIEGSNKVDDAKDDNDEENEESKDDGDKEKEDDKDSEKRNEQSNKIKNNIVQLKKIGENDDEGAAAAAAAKKATEEAAAAAKKKAEEEAAAAFRSAPFFEMDETDAALDNLKSDTFGARVGKIDELENLLLQIQEKIQDTRDIKKIRGSIDLSALIKSTRMVSLKHINDEHYIGESSAEGSCKDERELTFGPGSVARLCHCARTGLSKCSLPFDRGRSGHVGRPPG